MPKRRVAGSKEGYDVHELTSVQLAQVTRLLYMAQRCTTKEQYEAWLVQQVRLMKYMDKALFYEKPKGVLNVITAKLEERQLLWFSDKTQLCPTHKVLHPGLIHDLTMMVAEEVTVYVDRYRYLRRKDKMDDWLYRWLDRVDTISMLWMGQEAWEEAFDRCLPVGTQPHYAVNIDCDACKLACIGGDRQAIKDIRTSLLARVFYFREKYNDPTYDGPFLLRMTESWINSCYLKQDRHEMCWTVEPTVWNLVKVRKQLRADIEAEEASGKYPKRKRHPHVPKLTASGLPLPRPTYTDQEVRKAKEQGLGRGVYRDFETKKAKSYNDERDDSEPDNGDTRDEVLALKQRLHQASSQTSSLKVPQYPEDDPAASSVYSEPPFYVRPPVKSVKHPHPAFVEDAPEDAENHYRFSYELPRVAPLWNYMKARHMQPGDPNAIAPASTPEMQSWEEEYINFIKHGGSGDDYYETDEPASVSYDADDGHETRVSRKEAPLFTQDNTSYKPIRRSWVPEFGLESDDTPIRYSAIPEPLVTTSPSKTSDQSSHSRSQDSPNTSVYSDRSAKQSGPVPNPGGRPLQDRPFIRMIPEEHETESVGSFQGSRRRVSRQYNKRETQQYTESQLRKGKYVVRESIDSTPPPAPLPTPSLHEDCETLARLEGRSSKPLVRSNAIRVRLTGPDSRADVHSMQAVVEDVADDMNHLSVQGGVRLERSQESMASCYSAMGWGGPRRH